MEQIAIHPDVIAQIEQLVESKALLADEVELDVNLQLLSALLQVSEAGLALQAQRDNAARNFHGDAGVVQLLASFRPVLSQDLRHSVRRPKSVRIGLLAKGFDLAQLLLAQLICAVFKG